MSGQVGDALPLLPRQVLVFDQPGTATFCKADYPWLVAIQVLLRGADGGTAGQHGEGGYMIVELYDQPIAAGGVR